MKKTVFLFCLGMLFGIATNSRAQNIKDVGESKYQLSVGQLTMLIDAAHGGKILSFKHGDTEVISQSRWPESFGSTFWTSPQKEWNWPPVQEYDKQQYEVNSDLGQLTLTSGVNDKLKFRIRKRFVVDNSDNSILVTYTIINEDDKVRKVAPWEITRVPNDGLIFFDAKLDEITPAGMMPFQSAYDAVWYTTDVADQNRKVNADGKGWLAYSNNGLLLIKQFADLDKSEPAPGEAEIQVYVNRGKSYIELESQGAYKELQPKESLSWTVKWQLVPVENGQQPSRKLLNKARKLTKSKVQNASSGSDVPVVRISSGMVKGISQEGTIAFLGIPYAKVERFMPPQPVDAWKGIRACDHWGPQAMQPTYGRELSEAEMSEKNSCVINVWTTDCNASKPVMVWLHGGGFDSGTSAWNPGMGLAKKDVVVVSINHRLNILGFLDLSAASDKYRYSGNVGMLDVVAALNWVKKNIRQFGGDPDNVTIFGESGGGGKVGTLLCMPKAKGLFHKAIIMSGTILNVNTKAMSEELGVAVLKELGIDKKHIDRIKDVPYRQLYEAGQRAMAASIGTRKPGTPMMWGFGPSPDGEILLQQPFQPDFPSISNDVPIMIGTTFNELQRLQYDRDITEQEAKETLKKTFDSDTDNYITAMRKAWPGSTPQDLLSIDWLFRPKTIITADAIAETRNAPTYMYMFTWRSPVNKGSVHGHELKFCFNTLHHSKNELPQPTDEDIRLADIMSSVWAQFAHNGNPNIDGLPNWNPYTAKNGEMMVFNHNCGIRNNPDRQLQEIINKHCFKQLDEFNKR